MDDFNMLLYNPDIALSERLWGLAAQYHKYCLYDLPYRCMMGIVDHRSLNRAMEFWFIGRLLWRAIPLSTDHPKVWQGIVEFCHEYEMSVVDVYNSTKYHPAYASNRRESMDLEVRRVYKAIESLGADVALREICIEPRVVYTEDGMKNLPSAILPFQIEDKDSAREFLSAIATYGRNLAHWDDYSMALESLEPEYLPCELYNDPDAPRDFSVYEGAPLTTEETY
jgi:hypothetical protein